MATNWWGKLLGGTFGFMLGGPIGALLGAALGHTFDRSLAFFDAGQQVGWDSQSDGEGGDSASSHERVQAAFFTATFGVMGHIAKADGRVTESEIAQARSVMQHMQLDAEQQSVAIGLFNQGKQPDFPYIEVLAQLKRVAQHSSALLQMFLEIQIGMALADGELHEHEQKILRDVATRLGFSTWAFEGILVRVIAQRGFAGFYKTRGHSHHEAAPGGTTLTSAYRVLGVEENADDGEVKKAYRRLMNQHHPDKLVAKGLPEEMMQVATEKTREIKAAYELIKKSRQAVA
ncbi:MAG: co-chaperone DjlA [Hahellaceae bacterium]|nr:co-chaperone DjlA [Hahellaceae bacterium]MCP5169292.1 co-chaperone DjlA [Hahellaceae bacterium]